MVVSPVGWFPPSKSHSQWPKNEGIVVVPHHRLPIPGQGGLPQLIRCNVTNPEGRLCRRSQLRCAIANHDQKLLAVGAQSALLANDAIQALTSSMGLLPVAEALKINLPLFPHCCISEFSLFGVTLHDKPLFCIENATRLQCTQAFCPV